MTNEQLKSLVRNIPNFPKPGINFKDITTILNQPEAFEYVINIFSEYAKNHQVTAIFAPEARGFIFAAAVAFQNKLKFIPARKPGKLPAKTFAASYELEYGENTLQIHQDALDAKDRVMILDDLIATSGTIHACIDLINQTKAQIACIATLISLSEFKSQHQFDAIPSMSIISF